MMHKEILEEDVRKILADVKHPAIDRTLLDLGVINLNFAGCEIQEVLDLRNSKEGDTISYLSSFT